MTGIELLFLADEWRAISALAPADTPSSRELLLDVGDVGVDMRELGPRSVARGELLADRLKEIKLGPIRSTSR